jgi:hypothetical protein
MTDLSQYKTLLTDFITGCVLYLQYGGVFLSWSLYFMAICWRIYYYYYYYYYYRSYYLIAHSKCTQTFSTHRHLQKL